MTSPIDFNKKFAEIFGSRPQDEVKLIERPRCHGKAQPVIIEQPAQVKETAAWVDEAGDL